MTLYNFYLLTEDEQINLLYEHGVYIGKRKDNNTTTVLYQLDSFYVEIIYKKYRFFIHKINCFTTTEKLSPYLEQIDIEDVMKCSI